MNLRLAYLSVTQWIYLHAFTTSGHFTNKWAVHITAGEDTAKRIAEENGFSYVSKVKQ